MFAWFLLLFNREIQQGRVVDMYTSLDRKAPHRLLTMANREDKDEVKKVLELFKMVKKIAFQST